MKIQSKPDYLIFADSAKSGECTNFPDVSRGWGVTIDQTASKPPLEWMNGAFNRVDKNMMYLLQQGVPEWCESVKYPANAIIKYNGVLYTAIVENDNSNPATDTTKWKKTQEKIVNASTSQSGVVKLNSATDSTSETEAATPLAVKKANDNAITAKNNANDALNIASGAVKRSGDNMTGDLYIKGLPALKFADFGVGKSKVLGSSSVDNSENQFSGFLFSQSGSAGNKPFDFSHIVRSFAGDSFGDIAIDVLSKRAKFRGVLTHVGNPHYTGDYSWTEFVTTANISNYIPIGVPLPWPNTQPPAGWLECNGSTFNKNQFPKLAAAYPSGKLPDLRGVFIRGKDNGRGLDPNRDILSYQDDAIRNITGTFGFESAVSGYTGIPHISGAFYEVQDVNRKHISSSIGGQNTLLVMDASRVVPVSHDNHPRNVAFIYIVKAE